MPEDPAEVHRKPLDVDEAESGYAFVLNLLANRP